MRSKLTSGCSFAETGQVILSAEFIKRKYIWKGKSYWGCLPKVGVFSKYLVCCNICCCFVLEGNGLNINVINQIYHLSLVAALIYRAFFTLLWCLPLWKGILKHNCGSEPGWRLLLLSSAGWPVALLILGAAAQCVSVPLDGWVVPSCVKHHLKMCKRKRIKSTVDQNNF